MQIAAANPDGANAYLDLARTGISNRLFGKTKFTRSYKFGYEQCGYLDPL